MHDLLCSFLKLQVEHTGVQQLKYRYLTLSMATDELFKGPEKADGMVLTLVRE